MKNALVGFMVVNGALALVASAAPAQKLEQLNVQSITQTANLMPGPGPARPIYSKLQVEVVSTGCTRGADFRVTVKKTGDEQFVTIRRMSPDLCEVVAHPDTIEIETTALLNSQNLPVHIVNPMRVETHFVH
ncbi:MAG: hypothetical protein HYR96_13225 [Deltaproteobacteria bacterium]|nr:hypothetical protein [Deltaproteobacteria bacterium]MBI3295039.1 hypothetical protein [Deltaproteobacteria bacterium]